MPSNQEVATSTTTKLVLASLLTAVLVCAACGKVSGLRTSGGTTSTAAGGNAGSTATATSSSATGGSTGGHPSTASGGSPGAGGNVATGGRTAGSGGSTAAGGTTATGGRTAGSGGSTAAGGTTATGGRTTPSGGGAGGSGTGGSGSLAGSGGGGAWASGGSALGGSRSSGGTTGTSQPRDADPGDGGIVSSGYCAGDVPKLTYQGQTVTPAVTDYRSNIVMDCCNGYGVNLHASASLGFDVAVELILSLDIDTPNEYEVGGSSLAARAAVRKSGDALTSAAGINSQGSLRVFGLDTTTKTWALGMCLEVVDAASALWGTRIYVPRVTIGSGESNRRFQLFLLKDSTLRSDGVASQPLDDLVLADSPVLDLNRIAYVEKATTKIGFNPGQKIGDTLRTQLGTPLGLPFVAVADGARIYLGTFLASLSSIGPSGPYADVEDITSDGFTLRAPWSGTDPRNDERILKALTETGKLVP
ncbi:MAG: hypothetical protein JXP73_07845 [Deltaproteobacteria bacterium]|nr:hypothetical protein [Deltaproteobacteria bacterium]